MLRLPEARSQHGQEADFIEWCRMPDNPVAGIEAEREMGFVAPGAVGYTGQCTADAADHDGDQQRENIQVAGRTADPGEQLGNLNADNPTQKCAKDRLGAHNIDGIGCGQPPQLRMFGKGQQFRTQRRADNGAGQHRQSSGIADRIVRSRPQPQVQPKPDGIGQGFAQQMRRKIQSEDVQDDGKRHPACIAGKATCANPRRSCPWRIRGRAVSGA